MSPLRYLGIALVVSIFAVPAVSADHGFVARYHGAGTCSFELTGQFVSSSGSTQTWNFFYHYYCALPVDSQGGFCDATGSLAAGFVSVPSCSVSFTTASLGHDHLIIEPDAHTGVEITYGSKSWDAVLTSV